MWVSVLTLAVDQLVAWGALYYAYSVLSRPLARDLGVSMRVVAGAFTLTLVVAAMLARPVGRWLDRAGARPVLRAGAVMGPLALVAMAAARDHVTLFLAFAALGLAQSTTLYEPAFRAVVERYPRERDRLRALVALTSVGGLASTLFVPLTAWIVERVDWRAALLVLAASAGAVLIPASVGLPPAPVRASRVGSRDDQSLRPATRRHGRSANLIAVAFALQSFVTTGVTVSLVWALVETGWSMRTATLLAGLVGASQVLGRLLWTPVQRAVHTERRTALLFVIQACGLGGIAAGWMPGVLAGAVAFGAAGGVATLERATVTLEWWGPDRFGVQSGHLASTSLLARAAAPYAVEHLRTLTTYGGVFGAFAVCLAGGAVVFLGRQPTSRPDPLDAARASAPAAGLPATRR